MMGNRNQRALEEREKEKPRLPGDKIMDETTEIYEKRNRTDARTCFLLLVFRLHGNESTILYNFNKVWILESVHTFTISELVTIGYLDIIRREDHHASGINSTSGTRISGDAHNHIEDTRRGIGSNF